MVLGSISFNDVSLQAYAEIADHIIHVLEAETKQKTGLELAGYIRQDVSGLHLLINPY